MEAGIQAGYESGHRLRLKVWLRRSARASADDRNSHAWTSDELAEMGSEGAPQAVKPKLDGPLAGHGALFARVYQNNEERECLRINSGDWSLLLRYPA